jgi:hypothetical protein
MSTVIDRSVAFTTQQPGSQRYDRRRRRFGYAPGIYQMAMESRDSGWNEALLPQGCLIPFRTATLKDANYEIKQNPYEPQIDKDFEAAYFCDNVKAWYGPQGFIEVSSLTFLEDEEAYALFDLLYEPLLCSFWEDVREDGQTDECATCRIRSLESDEMQSRMLASGLDYAHLEPLRLALLESNRIRKSYCSVEWASKVGEMDEKKTVGRGLAVLKAGEHHLRRHIHIHAPADHDVLTATASGKETAEQMSQGFGQLAEAMTQTIAAQQEQTRLILEQQAADRKDAREDRKLLYALIQKQSEPAKKEKAK